MVYSTQIRYFYSHLRKVNEVKTESDRNKQSIWDAIIITESQVQSGN